MKRFFCATVASVTLLTTAMAHAEMNPNQPLEVEKSFWGPILKQGGVSVDGKSAIDELLKKPATASQAQVANVLWYTVLPIAFASGGFLTAAAIEYRERGRNFAWGVGLFVAAELLENLERHILASAAEIHNLSLQGSGAAEGSSARILSPFVAFVPNGAVGGFTFQF